MNNKIALEITTFSNIVNTHGDMRYNTSEGMDQSSAVIMSRGFILTNQHPGFAIKVTEIR